MALPMGGDGCGPVAIEGGKREETEAWTPPTHEEVETIHDYVASGWMGSFDSWVEAGKSLAHRSPIS